MRLFSEKVVPTYTSSNLNILTVKDYNEVFFDVFEFEINGKKFIAEKSSNYKGSPVVDIPLVLEGKEFTASFVLQRGKFEILFNKANSTFVGPAVQEATEPIIQFVEHENEIEDIVFEKKESILKEIHQAKQSAEQYVEELKQQKLRETTKFFDDKKQILDKEISESKKSLLDEFLSLVENVKSEFYEFSESEKTRLVSFIKESIDSLSDDLSKDIEDKNEQAEKVFSEKINELATNVLSGVLLKEIDSNNKKTNKDINTRFEAITTSLNKLTEQRDSRLKGEMKEILGEYSGSLNSLEQANIELNNLINKSNNKALSRIGNVKTQLEESILYTGNDLKSTITNTKEELLDKIQFAENSIITFYDERINLVETKVTDLTEENKQYFIDLIAESKQTLLDQINNIKVDVPNIIIEKSNGKQEVDLKGIKSELEKIIGTRFSTELMALKRLIEMSSGGGSVAVQFANGGTMNGNLTVVGTISASQYLGIPVSTNSINVSTLSATSLSANTIYTAQLNALSANIAVQGNCTVQGNVQSSGNLTIAGNSALLGTTTATGKITANGQGASTTLTDNDVITKKALNEWPFLSPYQPIYDYPLNAGWSTAAGGTGVGVNQTVDYLNLTTGQSSTAYTSAQVPRLQLTPLATPTVTGYSRIDWNGKLFIDVVVQPAFSVSTTPPNQYKGVRQINAIAASYIGAAATTNIATFNTVGPGLCLSPIATIQSASVSVGILTYYPSSTSIEVRIIQSLKLNNSGNKVLSASNTTPIIITTAGTHSLNTGDNIEVAGVLGNVAANGFWTVSATSATTLSLNGSVGSGAYTVGGAIQITSPVLFTQTGLNMNRYTLQVTGGIATLYVNDIERGSLSGFYTGTGSFGSFITYANTTAAVTGLSSLGGGNFFIRRCRVGGIF